MSDLANQEAGARIDGHEIIEIPTVSPVGLTLLALLIAGFGVRSLRRFIHHFAV